MRVPKNNNRVAVVTGATGAIGQALVAGLTQKNYKVILLIRNELKGIETISNIRNANSKANLEYRVVDLSVQSEIKSLSKLWNENIDILINNAAITPHAREETQEGIELQFATNVLGYYWMINHFTDILQESAPSRIVNIASYWAGGLDLSDLEFKTRSYHNHDAYRQSKQANRMLTPIQADQFNPTKVTINACHPGDVNSKLSNNLGFGGSQSPTEGADTPLWLATSEDLFGITGKYFETRKEVSCPFGSNRIESEKLNVNCQSY